jgi:hypothetical protein
VVPSRLPKSTRCPRHPPMGEQGDHREQPQSRAGVVLRIANSVHCLCVSNPRCLRASWKVTSSCQRITNQRTICSGSASRSVQRRAWALNSPSGSRTSAQAQQASPWSTKRPSEKRSRPCAARSRTSSLSRGRLPNGDRVFDDRRKVGQPLTLYARSPYLAWAPRRGRFVRGTIQPEAGDEGQRPAQRSATRK